MARQIVTAKDVHRHRAATQPQGLAGGIAAAPAPAVEAQVRQDEFTDRLLKYIPSEVIAVYVLIDGILRSAPDTFQRETFQWIAFCVLLAGTWLYLWRVQNVTKRSQLAISTIAFAVWVFSLGGPFSSFKWYSPIYGALLLPLYTFAVPIIGAEPKTQVTS